MGINDGIFKNKGEQYYITVIIRTHNSADFVENALTSVFNQTLSPELYEILVVDDGSTDKTCELLKEYADKIKIIEMEKVGPIKAINVGINKSLSKYIILLDSDDTFEPNALEIFFESIESSDVDFVYSDYYEKNVGKNIIKIISVKDNIFNTVAGGIMFKKTILEDFGGYNEQIFFPEYDLLIKLLKSKCKYKYIPAPLFTYYRHENSITANKSSVKAGYKELFAIHGHIKDLREY